MRQCVLTNENLYVSVSQIQFHSSIAQKATQLSWYFSIYVRCRLLTVETVKEFVQCTLEFNLFKVESPEKFLQDFSIFQFLRFVLCLLTVQCYSIFCMKTLLKWDKSVKQKCQYPQNLEFLVKEGCSVSRKWCFYIK